MEVQSLSLLESVENPLNGCSSDAATKDQLSELSLQLKEEEVEAKSASIMHVSQLVGKTVSMRFDVGRRVSARLQKKEKPFSGNQKAERVWIRRVVVRRERDWMQNQCLESLLFFL